MTRRPTSGLASKARCRRPASRPRRSCAGCSPVRRDRAVIRELLIAPEARPARSVGGGAATGRVGHGRRGGARPRLGDRWPAGRRPPATTTAGTWQTLRDYWGMDGGEAAETAALAIDLLRAGRPCAAPPADRPTMKEQLVSPTTGIGHVAVLTEDLDRSVDFSTSVFVEDRGRLRRSDYAGATGTAGPRRPFSSAATSTTSPWAPRRPRRSRPFAPGSWRAERAPVPSRTSRRFPQPVVRGSRRHAGRADGPHRPRAGRHPRAATRWRRPSAERPALGRPASEQAGDGAPVDRQVDAGDEAGVLGAEEGHDLAEVVGVAHEAGGDARAPARRGRRRRAARCGRWRARRAGPS